MTEAAVGPAPAPGAVASAATAPFAVERCADRFRASACAFLPAGVIAGVLAVFIGVGPSVVAAAYLTVTCAAVFMFPVARWTTMSMFSEAPVRPAAEPVVVVSWARNAVAALIEMAIVSGVGIGLGLVFDRSLATAAWPAFLAPILLGFALLTLWQGHWCAVVEARRGGILVRPAGLQARRSNAQLVPTGV